jgi:hypothetical protein
MSIPEAERPLIVRLIEQRLRGQSEMLGGNDPASALAHAAAVLSKNSHESQSAWISVGYISRLF